MRTLRFLAVISLLMILPCPLPAIEDLPPEGGWSGFVNLGLGITGVESNLIVGNDLSDLGEDTIDSVNDGPGKNTARFPVLNGEIGYFFSTTRTYVVLGNALEDLLRYDFTTVLGVRQGLPDESILAVEVLFSAIPATVWQDPYLEGEPRDETDRESAGARITWDRIAGSGLEVSLMTRSITIDDEASGEGLGLSSSERRLLSREGRLRGADVSYRFRFAHRHTLLPRLRLRDHDLDGDAMAHKRRSLEVTYVFASRRFQIIVNAFGGSEEYEEDNPIYGRKRADDRSGITITGLFPNLFGSKTWIGLASAGNYEGDSNIDFYDARASLLVLSALRRF